MSFQWRVVLSAVIGLVGVGLALSAEAQQTRSGMEINLVSDRSVYRSGEPIALRLALINTSSHAIKYQPTTPLGAVSLVVLDDQDNKVEPNVGASLQFGGGPRLTIQPGERIPVRGLKGESIDLTEWGYDLKEPGKYTIVAVSPEVSAGAALQRAATASASSQVTLTIAK